MSGRRIRSSIDAAQLERIASRFVALRKLYGATERTGGRGLTELASVKLAILGWNARDPIDFDQLERFNDLDFVHDVGGMYSNDMLMTPKCAINPVEMTRHPPIR